MDMQGILDQPSANDRCRTCMMRISTTGFNIFERHIQNTTVAEILHSFTALTFHENDAFPQVVCQPCYDKLYSFYEFIVYIENVDTKYKEVYKEKGNLFLDEDQGEEIFNFVGASIVDTQLEGNNGRLIKDENSEDEYSVRPDSLKCEAEEIYICKLCNKYFTNEGNFQRHIKLTKCRKLAVNNSKSKKDEFLTSKDELICKHCNNSFESQEALFHHLETCILTVPSCNLNKTISHKNFSYQHNSCNYKADLIEIEIKTQDKESKCNYHSENNKEQVNHLKQHLSIQNDCRSTKIQKGMTDLTPTKDSELMCEICKRRFKNKHLMSAHMQKHVERARMLTCSTCSKVFTKVSHLKRHQISANCQSKDAKEILKDPDVGEFACEICEKKFKKKHSMIAHMRKHVDKGRVLSCSKCGKVFSKVSHVKRHELTHEEKHRFKCDFCSKSYSTEERLQEHLKLHKDPKICPVCQKAFANIPTLNAHIKIHTRSKLYLCSYCGKRFDSSTNLKQHLQRHLGIRAYACSLCPRKFVSKGELKSHKITHTGEKPHKCKQCNAVFTKKSSLKKHNNRHLGIKPFECDTCFKKFSSSSALKLHYRIHTGEKPYACEICARAFTQSNDLDKHRRKHLGDKLFKCDQCTESFRLKTELKHHIAQHFVAQLQETNMAANTDLGDHRED